MTSLLAGITYNLRLWVENVCRTITQLPATICYDIHNRVSTIASIVTFQLQLCRVFRILSNDLPDFVESSMGRNCGDGSHIKVAIDHALLWNAPGDELKMRPIVSSA